MENDLISRGALWTDIMMLPHNGGIIDSDEVERCIANAPAVDAESVRYEHWDENGRCTGCGNHAPFWSMASTYYLSPYCQHCGARMDW